MVEIMKIKKLANLKKIEMKTKANAGRRKCLFITNGEMRVR